MLVAGWAKSCTSRLGAMMNGLPATCKGRSSDNSIQSNQEMLSAVKNHVVRGTLHLYTVDARKLNRSQARLGCRNTGWHSGTTGGS